MVAPKNADALFFAKRKMRREKTRKVESGKEVKWRVRKEESKERKACFGDSSGRSWSPQRNVPSLCSKDELR